MLRTEHAEMGEKGNPVAFTTQKHWSSIKALDGVTKGKMKATGLS